MQPLSPDPKVVPLDPGASPELTRAILARTSGDPCQRLQSLACDFVDGSLEAGQASLVRLHLGCCGPPGTSPSDQAPTCRVSGGGSCTAPASPWRRPTWARPRA